VVVVEFNGAAVLSLESALRGRGNGGVAPLWKGKWRWHSVRRLPAEQAVAVRQRTRGGSRRRSRLSGLIRPGGSDDRVGRFQKWKTKIKMELGWATRDV
jgi:hypothetical protein